MDEIRALADRAAEQLAVYPEVTGKEKLKRFIRGNLLGQKLAPIDPFSWPNAMLGEGLLAAFETTGEKKYLLAVTEHLERWKSAGFPIHYVDNLMNGSLALWTEELLCRDSGGFDTEEKETLAKLCRSAERACAEWAGQAPKTQQGLLAYRAQHPDWLFVDTVGMVSPFLCRYGMREQDEALWRLGAGQLQLFWKRGMEGRSGLPYHGYDEKNGMKYSIVGWGRACGWLMKGLAQSLPWIPGESREYAELSAAFVTLAGTVGRSQRQDGGFSWQLPALEGHRDSSAEGMIGAAIAEGLAAGLFDQSGAAAAEKAGAGLPGRGGAAAAGASGIDAAQAEALLARLEEALWRSVSDGVVKDCSGECRGFGEYPQNYGSYPWGTGSALYFLAYRRMRRKEGSGSASD